MSETAAGGPAGPAGSVPAASGRGRSRPRLPDWSLPWLAILAVLVVFELAPRLGLIAESSFPPVSETLRTLAEQIFTADFWSATAQTMQGWAIGLAIALGAGIPLGILIGSSPLGYRAARPVIEFLRPIPSVALIPLAILVYGTGMQSKVFLAAFAAFWQVIVPAIYGVQDVDPVATDTARSFGFSRRQRLLRVTLPSALPYIATGVRVASAVALILAVTAELVIGAPGLGHDINLARQGGNVELMYALIIATGLLGLLLNAIFIRLERRLLHWHPSHREQVPA